MNRFFRWPDLPSDFSGFIHRKAEDLYEIPDAEQAENGLIHCTVLPLRDLVLFPNMVTPLFLETESSMKIVEQAISSGKTMIAAAQIDPDISDPKPEDLFVVGTEIAVGRLMQIPDGTSSVLTQGRRRVEIVEYFCNGPDITALARPVDEIVSQSKETTALMRVVLTLFEKYVELSRSLPDEAYIYALNIDDPGWLGDLIASTLEINTLEAQKILEVFDPITRLQQISVLLGRELDVLELEDEIHLKVQNEFDRSQREMYLREQMKAIQTELGESDLWAQDVIDLREKVEKLDAPEEVRTKTEKELSRLAQMPAMSPEVGIIRTYLEWLLDLPWNTFTSDNLDVLNASEILNRDHYGLKDAKDRILEYIAVQQLAGEKQRQPILCFAGPPGTGKTSIGRSIAEALGRKFIRISLGGIRDEAEIRGHRRTYIGALPGRIIQAIRRAESANPLFMLDEIDKLGIDFRGDPASALLEVLDPEQNNSFSDHYLEVPFNLSRVLFITTANNLDTIPSALLDRMEVIEFPGYIEEEKIHIARNFLIPRQLEQNGFDADALKFTIETLQRLIREYTWEAGVRNLEREIGKICRKIARRKVEGKKILKRVQPDRIELLLGPPQLTPPQLEDEDMVGIAFGLAWTENGGEIVEVEVSFTEGKGNLQITGQVGEVMQESAQAALTYMKSRADILDIDPDLFEKCDIHIHIPEAAIPKDGPSAGITLATALISAAIERPVRSDLAMSGEITLRGRVLPVGGVREKVMAGYRMKLKTVILPAVNERHLVDIPRPVRSSLEIKFVKHMDEVLEIAFEGLE